MSMGVKNSFNGQIHLADGLKDSIGIPAWVYHIAHSSFGIPNNRAVALQRTYRE